MLSISMRILLNLLLLLLLPGNFALKEDDQQDSPRVLIRSRSSGNSYFKCGPENSTQVFCVSNRQVCVSDPITNTNSCVCIAGWGGVNCLEDLDECSSEDYPCTGERDLTSFCVDMDPPIRYKCGCLPGFTAFLPDETDDDVPVEYRPVACIPDTLHATPSTTPMTTTTAIPSPTASPTPPLGMCTKTSDCQGFLNNNFICSENGTCLCKPGFFKVSANCQDVNECSKSNNCHRNADCFNTVGSYSCKCKDGFEDVNPSDPVGTKCKQVNECELGTDDCDEDKICIDRTPPEKWTCIDPTPAPTPAPTPLPTPGCTPLGDCCNSDCECCPCPGGVVPICSDRRLSTSRGLRQLIGTSRDLIECNFCLCPR